MLSAYKPLLLSISASLLLLEAFSVCSSAQSDGSQALGAALSSPPPSPTLSPKNIERLRQMFGQSQKLATESAYELNVLNHLQQKFNDNGGQAEASNRTMADQGAALNSGRNTTNASKEINLRMKSKDGGVILHPASTDHSKASARQSPFFSGLHMPAAPAFPNSFGATGSNQLLHLPSLPTIPTLPAFHVAAPKPPPQPKSSIIGNNGGPMALTNDNVVVVNVLSNNY